MRRPDLRQRTEHGFTITELAVVMLVLGVVAPILFGFLNSATETTTRTAANNRAEADSEVILRSVTSDLRSASRIETAYPSASDPATDVCPAGGSFTTSPYAGFRSCITVVISKSTNPCDDTTVTYGLNGGTLRMRRIVGTGGSTPSCTSVTTTKSLLTGVVNSSAEPLFTYYRDGKDLLASTPPVAPVDATTIKVTTKKVYRNLAAEPLTFTNVVALRNKR